MNHKVTKTQRTALDDKVLETARLAVDAAFQVHSILGPGLLIKGRINHIII